MADGDLEWFRAHVCRRADHTHGEGGELDCLMEARFRLRNGEPVDQVVPGARPS